MKSIFTLLILVVCASSSAQTELVADLEPGFYNLTISDAYGCIAVLTFEVKLVVGNNFPDSVKHQFKIFPNPAKDYIIFSWEELPEPSELKIYNTVGQEVWKGILMPNDIQLKLGTRGFPNGVYYYMLTSKNTLMRISQGSLIIQKN